MSRSWDERDNIDRGARPLHISTDGRGVRTITLNRPERRNALSVDLVDALLAAFGDIAEDHSVRVVVLTHNGPAFCAGADLAGKPGGTDTTRRLAEVLSLIQTVPVPVVARVAGPAMAGGLGLVAACDLSIAAEDVQFAVTEVRLGLAPALISTILLPKMSRAAASEWFLTAARFNAADAVTAGIINRAVPRTELQQSLNSTVDALLAGAPEALGHAKNLIHGPRPAERAAEFDWAAKRSAELFASAEAAEGIAAFKARRPPNWVVPTTP